MSGSIPLPLQRMLETALGRLQSEAERAELAIVVQAVAEAAWTRWIGRRSAEDNRQEHEFVVFDNYLRIAESERLSVSDKRIGAAFAFLHDTAFIHRITETEIRREADPARRSALQLLKAQQRERHMTEGAANAKEMLSTLCSPSSPNRCLYRPVEIDRCASLIARHDVWKLGQPWPLSDDRLALACVEADALWPLHPLGVLADLERPNESGRIRDSGDPNLWLEQVRQSLATLREFQANWASLPQETFPDDSIFRTPCGAQIYRAWRAFWAASNQETIRTTVGGVGASGATP